MTNGQAEGVSIVKPMQAGEITQMIAAITMSEHEKGYRAAKAGTHAREWKDHWSGAKPSTRDPDWFFGYQDALDDTAMGNPPMYS